ncbi:MAG: hypothetical protein JXA25_04225 [Anaerolineales bacterium]|nr:hypothetical protein [Anaerolineales bacterium]
MSLIGIDVGSSSVKAAAYSIEGKLLAQAGAPLSQQHPAPGLWEQDPEEIWQAAAGSVRQLMQSESMRRDPPEAAAISASGRENFLADKDGNPLTQGVMGADIRGAEFERVPPGVETPEPWCLSCGHLRERMDPIFRLAWWRREHPEIVEQATYFFGWHDFLAFRLAGRIVSDRSIASRYLVYDLENHQWDTERINEFKIPETFLPEIQPWPSLIGPIRNEAAEEWGLPENVVLALGGHDVNCAAVGAGALENGVACLISGSYENLIVVTDQLPTRTMLKKGLSVMPHPGYAGYSVLAVCPTGNVVLNWARDILDVSIEDVENELLARPSGPSPVMAVPYLSGSMVYWENGRCAKGGLLGLTLATDRVDIVQSFMESIAYDHVNTLSLLHEQGIGIHTIRAVGGGVRSGWWNQLKADLTGSTIEVSEHQEAGTLGAAILAGAAIGKIEDMNLFSRQISGTGAVYKPKNARKMLHQDRIDLYRRSIPTLISSTFEGWDHS